ncbi:MAG: chromosome partitioning ATPase [Burkholderiales bacterium]|nr:MAG: chromosome partitioning ATPase [Burkholderiales bacterium]
MSMIERAVSRLGDDVTPVRSSVTDLSDYADRPASRSRRPAPVVAPPDEPVAFDDPPPRRSRDPEIARPAPASRPAPVLRPAVAPVAETLAPAPLAAAPRAAAPVTQPGPRAPRAEAAPRTPRAAGAAPRVRLDVKALAARGYVTPDSPATRLSNEFRVIKRPLIANASGRGRTQVPNGHRVMVTSANPDEGKSFCAVNLALSIAAERDLQVLLIDADVARPSLQRELRLQSGPGLMDLLLDPTLPLEATVRETDIDKLAVMTAGTLSDNANELLASDAMGSLLDLISERYPDRIVIFDAPPLLPTTEARVLAGLMGQIALVVEAGVTPQGAVEEALSTIEACPVIGVILNKADERRAGGYGYGYGYGHGSN